MRELAEMGAFDESGGYGESDDYENDPRF